jgi:hypothetical protein
MSDWLEAGKGDNHLYLLAPPNQGPSEPLIPEKHYIGVESASWFINKQSNWFRDQTASGTLKITMAGGREEYNVALGTFELEDGARTAPIFDRPVLPDRRYQGGVLTFLVSLTSLARDTAFASVLKSSARASLNIVGGMVETATATGPQQILGAAGSALVKGIGDALANTAQGRAALFSGDGIESSIRPETFSVPEMYLLFHRGTRLDTKNLKTAVYGQMRVAVYNNKALEDGAWLLLRLRRSVAYSGVRAWFDEERKLRAAFDDLVSDVGFGTRTRAEALAQLSPGDGTTATLYDEFIALRRLIRDDGVLTRVDAKRRVDDLSQARTDALTKINSAPVAATRGIPNSPGALRGAPAASPLRGLEAAHVGDWENTELQLSTTGSASAE